MLSFHMHAQRRLRLQNFAALRAVKVVVVMLADDVLLQVVFVLDNLAADDALPHHAQAAAAGLLRLQGAHVHLVI